MKSSNKPKSSKKEVVKEKINDLDLSKWKDYEDLITDSLWLIQSRDKSGAHSNIFHGNFVPQIPNQLIRRFTKPGDVIVDAFLGSGTTLIEAQRLGRLGIGVELSKTTAAIAQRTIEGDCGSTNVLEQNILIGDSRSIKIKQSIEAILSKFGKTKVELLILHPPYDNILKFSEDESDLSNMPTTQRFIEAFGDVIENLGDFVKKNGHIALVIGDKYSESEWVPLGFNLMQETLDRSHNLILKSVIVKNMSGNRAKQNQEQLWRYRSLSGGFYVFKHEYIFLFKRIK